VPSGETVWVGFSPRPTSTPARAPGANWPPVGVPFGRRLVTPAQRAAGVPSCGSGDSRSLGTAVRQQKLASLACSRSGADESHLGTTSSTLPRPVNTMPPPCPQLAPVTPAARPQHVTAAPAAPPQLTQRSALLGTRRPLPPRCTFSPHPAPPPHFSPLAALYPHRPSPPQGLFRLRERSGAGQRNSPRGGVRRVLGGCPPQPRISRQ
jgi:hypothetical protein